MSPSTSIGAGLLALDAAQEVERLTEAIREQVFHTLKRRGVVLGLSGGVDSSVCAALCARAVGAERVTGLLMPELDSAPETTPLGRLVGERFGITTVLEDITGILQAAGCYERRDAGIRAVVPEYAPGDRSKLVLERAAGGDGYAVFSIVVEGPGGRVQRRLTADAYRTIVAATNLKQRVRKTIEYHYADRFQYAVAGTPNLPEYDQGFFVKNGDGAADFKPIAHLYKSQVYQLAEALGVPAEICARPPTTDTWSMAQTQEEFYFALPYAQMDLCLYGLEND